MDIYTEIFFARDIEELQKRVEKLEKVQERVEKLEKIILELQSKELER